jgi:hypothetical protein
MLSGWDCAWTTRLMRVPFCSGLAKWPAICSGLQVSGELLAGEIPCRRGHLIRQLLKKRCQNLLETSACDLHSKPLAGPDKSVEDMSANI